MTGPARATSQPIRAKRAVGTKDAGALPRTPALPQMRLYPVIPSSGQAEPYARTPEARKGSLRSASGRPLHAPETRAQPAGCPTEEMTSAVFLAADDARGLIVSQALPARMQAQLAEAW
jgi:hypothetical protein